MYEECSTDQCLLIFFKNENSKGMNLNSSIKRFSQSHYVLSEMVGNLRNKNKTEILYDFHSLDICP